MKKLILMLFIPLVLVSCAKKSYTPIIDTSFSYDAKYIMGDFCFNCNITKSDQKIIFTVKDTRAQGLIMCYDGQNVEFKKDNLSYTLNSKNLDQTNPSILLKNIFSYIESNLDTCVTKTENGYKYNGMIPIGEFNLYQNSSNEFYLITIPSANIKIELSKVDI